MSIPSARAASWHAATKFKTTRIGGRRSPFRASETVLSGSWPFDNLSILLREGPPAAARSAASSFTNRFTVRGGGSFTSHILSSSPWFGMKRA